MDATFNQRRALFNMWTALHEKDKLKTVHKLTFEQASAEIDKAKKQIEKKGFPQQDNEE